MKEDKLLESMNYINQAWIEQARPADEGKNNIKKICGKKAMGRKYKIYRNIAAAAAAVLVISVTSYTGIYAYQKYHKPESNVEYSTHMNDDSAVNIYNEKKTYNDENSTVEVEWGNYAASGTSFYIEVIFRSKDGKPVIPNEESDKYPITGSFNFRKTYMSIDNQLTDDTVYAPLRYIGMSDDGTEVYTELALNNKINVDIPGHTIRIKGENLVCGYANNGDSVNTGNKQIATGEWSFETYVENSSTGVITASPDVKVFSVNNPDEFITVSDIETDGFKIKINAVGTMDPMSFGVSQKDGIKVTLKDGTTVETDGKLSDMKYNDKKHIFEAEYSYKKVLAVEDIEKIQWHDVTLYEAQ